MRSRFWRRGGPRELGADCGRSAVELRIATPATDPEARAGRRGTGAIRRTIELPGGVLGPGAGALDVGATVQGAHAGRRGARTIRRRMELPGGVLGAVAGAPNVKWLL